jgi:hypothetical protein
MAPAVRRWPGSKEVLRGGERAIRSKPKMLSELLKAIEANAKPGKTSFFWWGLAVFVSLSSAASQSP